MKIDLTLDEIGHQRFHNTYRRVKKLSLHTTKLSADEIERLLITYYKFIFVNRGRGKQMTRSQLEMIFQVYFGMPEFNLTDQLLASIDPGTKNNVSPEGFLKMINIFAYGTFEERMQLCFRTYDYPETGYITREKLQKLCRNMVHSDIQDDEEELQKEYVDFLLRKMDTDHDGRISYSDYATTVVKNPGLLEFLGKIFPNFIELGSIFGW